MRQSGVTYRHFTDDEIKKANSVDLLMLAKQYGYETEKGGKNAIHLKKSGGLYIFPNENCFYHHTSDERHKEVPGIMAIPGTFCVAGEVTSIKAG